jgi:hypothetical protein
VAEEKIIIVDLLTAAIQPAVFFRLRGNLHGAFLGGRGGSNVALLPEDHADIVGAKNIRSGALVIAREVSAAAESLVSRETSSIYNRGASA